MWTPGRRFGLLVVAALALGLLPLRPASSSAREAGAELRPASAFAGIAEADERSVAFFREAGKVLLHPRCVNCHPADDNPRRGEGGELHEPPVGRGAAGIGPAGMRCNTCHHEANFDPGRVPGAPHWRLAPRSMAWLGLSLGEICEQLKDPKRNGNRDVKAIVKHMEDDALVGWAWSPGVGREPAPGSHEAFGALIAAWAESGAVCPSD